MHFQLLLKLLLIDCEYASRSANLIHDLDAIGCSAKLLGHDKCKRTYFSHRVYGSRCALALLASVYTFPSLVPNHRPFMVISSPSTARTF